MLAKAHCHWHTVTFVQETWGRGGTHWDHQLCSTQSDAGAPYGSAHLPAERPIEACSLWRTFRVQVGPSIWAPASAKVPVGIKDDWCQQSSEFEARVGSLVCMCIS